MILMVFLLSATVVFAEDNDTSLGNTNTIDLPESSNDEKFDSKVSIGDVNNDSFSSNGDDSDLQQSSDNEDKLQATLTLTALKNLINGASGEVTLNDDYYYSSSTDSSSSVASYSASNFILNGNGRRISFGQNSWVFPKFTGSNIVLKNITFSYHNPIELKGSNITFIDCKFRVIQASNSNNIFRLIYSANVSCFTFIGCQFEGGYGIYASTTYDHHDYVKIKDCSFWGQVGYWLNVPNAEINNTNFTNGYTSSTTSYSLCNFGNASLNNCYFNKVSAPKAIPIISVRGSLNMSNVNFTYMTTYISLSSSSLISMDCRKNVTSIWNNTFFEQINTGNAPLINVRYGSNDASKLYVFNSTFKNNGVNSFIRGSENKGTFNRYIINCTFVDNQASYGVFGCIVYNSSFIRNTGFCGVAGTSSSFYNSYFYRNTAGTGGGAVHDPYIIKNCTFVSNSANKYGGSIGFNRTYHDILIENNTFLKSSAPLGGVLASYGESTGVQTACITITNNVVKEVSATDGGVIYTSFMKNNLTYLISNNDFNDISVSGCGGAFHIAEVRYNTGRFIVDSHLVILS